jgi:peptide chain release factor 3
MAPDISLAPTRSGVLAEAARRRTFAIISHPDAGKTTLTEKLLLYGGAVAEAGSVTARKGRRASTSDWMELERRRGISVSTTVLRFEYDDAVINLLDTPGHRDFSEDTLRVLAAADAAIILLDAARGVEAQTLRLFQVARARRIPLLTFVNKLDRPGMEPLELIDHLDEVLGVTGVPLTWPVAPDGEFRGVIDASTRNLHRFERTARGSTMAPEQILAPHEARRTIGPAWTAAEEELALAESAAGPFATDDFLSGERTPLLFGSALSNFGVGHLLRAVIDLLPSPGPRADAAGAPRPVDAPFSAVAFKVQANMDPRHRDRLAYLRICSGRFERGMRAVNARTGKPISLAYAHEVFAREREVLDEAFPGDVVGVVNATDILVGDSLYIDEAVCFPPIPTLAPEHFVTVHNTEPSRHKQFRRGLAQLDQEGVVHLLRRHGTADPVPILGAVGPLQLEVAIERLRSEFGVTVRLEPGPWKVARRTDAHGAAALGTRRSAAVLERGDGTLLAVFQHETALNFFRRDHPGARLDAVLTGRATG